MEPQCQVFTARWGIRGEPEVFNVMRGWCERHPPSAAWLRVPEQHRLRSAVTWARERMAKHENGRPGLSLLAMQMAASRCGVPSLGEPFAPSSSLLRPALEARRQLEAKEAEAYALTPARLGREPTPEEEERFLAVVSETERRDIDDWTRYTEGFKAEMRRSYRVNAIGWGWLLTLPRIVLSCQCARADRCHRSILAEALGKLGATVGGEIER
jgi:hypothetical protein